MSRRGTVGDGVVLRVGHAGSRWGEQAGLAVRARAGVRRALVVGVEPVRCRRPARARLVGGDGCAEVGVERGPGALSTSASHGALATGRLAMLAFSLNFCTCVRMGN
jgi:hypothetical protein